MYIIKVYSEDDRGYTFVGRIKGMFLTYEQAKSKIENQNQWCKNYFYFRIEKVNTLRD